VSDQHGVIAGRYRLLNHLASGGMGTVWLAWDERLSRAVAIKVLHPPVGATQAEARIAHDRAMREARITARLHHPHAVPVFDVVAHEGRPCLVMQYLPSRSLHDILAARSTIPPREAARIGGQVASALAVAHESGIIHRDITPGNILVTSDGTARITDFGISRVVGDVTLTSPGMVAGTPAYLAPEVARGAPSSTASDVYSLGATLYAAVEGAPPFGLAENPMALLHQVASGTITPPRRAGELSPMLERMLAPTPEERPAMEEVARTLGELAGEGQVARSVQERDPTTEVLPTGGGPGPEGKEPVGPRRTAILPLGPPSRPAGAATAERDGPAGPPHVPASTPPPPGPPPPGTRDEPAPERSRQVLAVLAGALVLALLLLAAWAIQRAGDAPDTAGPAPSRATALTTAPTTADTSPPRPSTRSTTAATTATTPARPRATATTTRKNPPALPAPSPTAPRTGSATTGAQLASAVRSYYELLPDGTDAGWSLLTERYRETTAGSRQAYEAFWSGIQAVGVSDVAGTAPASVVATVTYEMDDGRTIVERTSYSLLRQDGVLKIDRSSVLSSRQA